MPPEDVQWIDYNISIPSGAINSLHENGFESGMSIFQFLLVRLIAFILLLNQANETVFQFLLVRLIAVEND